MSALDALLLISPADVCDDVARGRRVARRVTGMVEARLRRQLVVRPHVQRLRSPRSRWEQLRAGETDEWARQWPVVLIASEVPTTGAPLAAPPVEAVDAFYAVDVPAVTDAGLWLPELGDETGERLGLTVYPDNGRAGYLAGFRREDQADDAGRAALNAAIAQAHPAWGTEALSAGVFARVPFLPTEIVMAVDELARGVLSLHGTGLGALSSRTEERGESRQRVQLARGWEEDVLQSIDHLAWADLGQTTGGAPLSRVTGYSA